MSDTTQPVARKARMNPALERYVYALARPKGVIALGLLFVLIGVALLAPVIFQGGYDVQSRNSLAPMSWAHPLGTDELGRDILVRSIYGLRTELSLVFTAVPVSMIIGTLLGLMGAISAPLGTLVQRMLDVVAGFPGLILGICIMVVLGAGWTALVIAISITGLPAFGRLARATLLTQLQREYVIAARTLGVGRWTIMVRHILPNAAEPIIVQGAVFVVTAIFIEAALSIVGLGLQPPAPSLGTILNVGMRYLTVSPSFVVGPTIILFLLALAFSLLADALNEALSRA